MDDLSKEKASRLEEILKRIKEVEDSGSDDYSGIPGLIHVNRGRVQEEFYED